MFKHLLVPLDGSALAETVLPFLGALARAFPVSGTLIRVLEKVQVEGCTQPVDPLEWQICKAEAESYLERMKRRTQDLGLAGGNRAAWRGTRHNASPSSSIPGRSTCWSPAATGAVVSPGGTRAASSRRSSTGRASRF